MAIVEPVPTEGGPRKLRLSNPATREVLGEIEVTSAEGVRAAVARARAAQPAWGAASFDERAAVMKRALKIVMRRQDEIVATVMRETGRSRFETYMMEVFPACDSLAWYAKHAARILGDEKRSPHLLRTKKIVVTYRPLGVVGIITPWNGPFIMGLNPSVQALMAGNAVLLKPSEVTPFGGRLVGEILREAGLPEGLLQVLDGDGETGAALLEAGLDKICFTGSVRTGRKVGEACGRNLVPCTLELGGKDPMIVCADADLERAAGGAVFGAFFNAGQYCCSTERVYVVDSVADELTRLVVEKASALKQAKEGEFDVGPMIWPSQLGVIERQMADAREKGAKVLCGGKIAEGLGPLFYEPTVLADVTHEMTIMRDETFGPILPIMRVKDEDEAIALANDSPYGLSANVWTKDAARALSLAKRIDSGSVSVNDAAVTYGATEAPFGGRKTSGVGQVNGVTGLRGYAYAMPIVIERFGPKAEHVWYPYTDEKGNLLRKIVKWVWGTPLGELFG